MKIGAGGLQAYVTHDDVASRQAQENRKPAEPVRPQDSENTATLNKDALNKTVEKLNDAAQAFDLPLRFAHKKTDAGTDYIEMRNTKTDRTKDIDLKEASELANKIIDSKGISVDIYI
ncbi:flagellar protein FlaG [Desulfoscipio gibsoniae]|uniref:FlaG protein n=1 Tax=Desulfoscipio gibsoniae DSM 7213 TaxID=767817 RepID=R4KES8_9FIRM|nr:flagellar protein FlaG [Desulfoscipio gibsoniae]AGL01703.1 FlaG protein [Desulfoscipio gibsoniae DSM 7213]